MLPYCDVIDTGAGRQPLWRHNDRWFSRGFYGRFLSTMMLMTVIERVCKDTFVPSFFRIFGAVKCLASDVMINWPRATRKARNNGFDHNVATGTMKNVNAMIKLVKGNARRALISLSKFFSWPPCFNTGHRWYIWFSLKAYANIGILFSSSPNTWWMNMWGIPGDTFATNKSQKDNRVNDLYDICTLWNNLMHSLITTHTILPTGHRRSEWTNNRVAVGLRRPKALLTS